MKFSNWAEATLCGALAVCLSGNIHADAATLDSSISATYFTQQPVADSVANNQVAADQVGTNRPATLAGLASNAASSAFASYLIDDLFFTSSVSVYASAYQRFLPQNINVSSSSTSSLTYNFVFGAFIDLVPVQIMLNGTASNSNNFVSQGVIHPPLGNFATNVVSLIDLTTHQPIFLGQTFDSPEIIGTFFLNLNDTYQITLSARAETSLLTLADNLDSISQATIFAPTFFQQNRALEIHPVIPEETVTPLPAALPLFVGGLGLIGLLARRRKQT